MNFKPFPKMARLSRECVVSEKLDGTNASVYIAEVSQYDDDWCSVHTWEEDGRLFAMFAGCRTRWVIPSNDNFGFASWVVANAVELRKLGAGHHFGEWYGSGIQRKYGLDHRRFALFNTLRWHNTGDYPIVASRAQFDKHGNEISPEKLTVEAPPCCSVVPLLYQGEFHSDAVENCLAELQDCGSRAVPGFPDPEGVVVYHIAAGVGFKKLIKNDDSPKALLK